MAIELVLTTGRTESRDARFPDAHRSDATRNSLRTRENKGTKCYQGFASSEGMEGFAAWPSVPIGLKSEEMPVAAQLFCGDKHRLSSFSGFASLVTVM